MAIVNCLKVHTENMLDIENEKQRQLQFLGKMLELLLAMDYYEVSKQPFNSLLDSLWWIFT